MGPEATSEAAAPAAQEQGARGVPAGTNPQATSEAPAPAVQEQPPSGAPQAGAPQQADLDELFQRPDVAERIRREAQSESDKRFHALRLQYEEEQRAARQRQEREARFQALEMMDDEELGRQHRREIEVQRQREAFAAQYQVQEERRLLEVQRQNAQQFVQSWLDSVPDKKAREEIRQQLEQGKYSAPKDFTDACKTARDNHLKSRLEDQVRKEAQEASRKDATARLAGTAIPDLASGRPAGTSPTYRKPEDRISAAIAKRMAEMEGG